MGIAGVEPCHLPLDKSSWFATGNPNSSVAISHLHWMIVLMTHFSSLSNQSSSKNRVQDFYHATSLSNP
jgi:hypothetical protein